MLWILLRSLALATFWLGVASAAVWGSQRLGGALNEHAPGWDWAPARIASTATWLGMPPPKGMNYQPVVTAALAITGTLAGVYFATVAFVISTTYREATSRVRSLVTRLPEGRVYTFLYVQAVLFALATLMLPLFGQEPNRLTLSTLAVLGSLVVLSFGRLRTQLYGLLEPAGLLMMVQHDVARWMKYALRGRKSLRTWRAQTARMQVQDSLTTLRELCRLIRDREHASPDTPAEYTMVDPRVRTAVGAVAGIWLGYGARKGRLIVLPGWCLMRERHKDWLLASEFEVGVALGTATTLQAESSEDHLWVERHLSSVLADLLGGRSAAQYSTLAGDLDQVLRHLVGWGRFNDARLWLNTAVFPAMGIVAVRGGAVDLVEAEAEAGPDLSSRPVLAHEHNLADFIVLSVAQLVLGLQDYAASIACDFPQWTTKQAEGHAKRSVGHRPAELFHNVADGLAFERVAEGRRITSDANIHQLAALAISTELIDETTGLIDTLEDTVSPWVQGLCRHPSHTAAAAASRMDEVLHKTTDVLFPALKRCFAACEAVHRDVDDRWPNLDLHDLEQRLARMKRDLRLPIARLASQADAQVDPDRPDIFGWAFYRAHADLLDDVLDDSEVVDLRERLLQLVAATDRAGSRMQTAVQRTHIRVASSYRAEPLLLLLQISGIAYSVDRFGGRAPLFDTFEGVWRYLLQAEPQRVLDTALAAVVADDLLFGFSPGKLTRSNRMQRALECLPDLELDSMGFRRPMPRGGRSDDSSDIDPARRVVLNHLTTDGDFEDVFVGAWLLPEAVRLGATTRADLTEGTRLQRLVDALPADHAAGPTSSPSASPHDGGDK